MRDGVIAVAILDETPIARENRATPHARRPRPHAVVLQPPGEVIKRLAHVVAELIELPDRQVAEPLPRLPLIVSHEQTAVVTNEHPPRVRRVDPHRLEVTVEVGRRHGEVAPAVERRRERHA